MALDSTLVRVAVTGGIYASLDNSGTVPTDASTSMSSDPDFEEFGYVTEDGVTQTIGADNEDIKAWQNGDTVRKVQTSHDLTYAFTLLETNPESLEVYYGNYDAGHVEITGEQLPRIPFVIDVLDGDHKIRISIPDGQVTERGEITYVNGGAISYPVTITCYPVDGVKAHLYLATVGS